MTHILTNIVPTNDDKTAFERTGLNWNVSKRAVYDESGNEIPNYFRTVRDDTNATLGMVQGRYEIMQNETLTRTPNHLIAAHPERNLQYSSAGELYGGRQVFASLDLKKTFDVVPGDSINSYLVVTTSHDGSHGTSTHITTIRPVCINTLEAGLSEAAANLLQVKIRHTKSAEERMEVAHEALIAVDESVDEFANTMRLLATRQVNTAKIKLLASRLFPKSKNKEEASTRTENKRANFLELFEVNDGDAVLSIRGTAYAALQSFTNHIDHFSSVAKTNKRGEIELELVREQSSVFGRLANKKQQALELILELTKNCPTTPIAMPSYSTGSGISDGVILDTILDGVTLN